MKISYARVSTFEQNLNMQLDALNKEGCKQVFTDKVSGIISSKSVFERLLEFTRDFYYWGLVLFLIIPSFFDKLIWLNTHSLKLIITSRISSYHIISFFKIIINPFH